MIQTQDILGEDNFDIQARPRWGWVCGTSKRISFNGALVYVKEVSSMDALRLLNRDKNYNWGKYPFLNSVILISRLLSINSKDKPMLNCCKDGIEILDIPSIVSIKLSWRCSFIRQGKLTFWISFKMEG